MKELKKEWGFLHPCHAAGGAFYYPASDVDAAIAEKDRQLKELYKKAGIAEAEVERLKKAIEKD